jgi:HAD-hyrolase-like
VFGRGTGVAFSILRRATGIDLLEDLSEFFRSFGDMSQGFRERADRVNALLADRRTAFVLVTSPRQTAIDEAIFFHHRILDGGLPFGAVIANRVHEVARDATTEGLAELLGEELARRVERNLDDYRRLAERDHANLALLRRRLGRKPMIEVPELDDEVHDLDGLRRLGEYLFGPRESVNHPSLSVRALRLDLDGRGPPLPGMWPFCYEVLNRGFRLVMDGAELVALQKNCYWLTADGLSLDVGPFVAAIEYATQRKAFVVGKPSPGFFELMLRDLGVEAKDAAMVGDDVETDVGGALRAGLPAILVRTGKHRADAVEASGIQPTATVGSIAEVPHAAPITRARPSPERNREMRDEPRRRQTVSPTPKDARWLTPNPRPAGDAPHQAGCRRWGGAPGGPASTCSGGSHESHDCRWLRRLGDRPGGARMRRKTGG